MRREQGTSREQDGRIGLAPAVGGRAEIVALPASVHIVGIGGMAMSGIAQLLLAAGSRVSGSDQNRTTLTERLRALGAEVAYDHAAEHLRAVDLVVTTAAAKDDNPELREAARRGIPVISRAAMVARLMTGRVGVAVAGTHGKTTTSTMIAWVLRQAGRDPAYLLGGESVDLGANAAAGSGPEIVVEADEYARAFLEYTPQVAVVTNVEADHLEYYGSVEAYEDAFRTFLRRVPADGTLIVCADSPRLAALADEGASALIARYSVQPVGDAPPAPPPTWLALDAGPGARGGHELDVLRDGQPSTHLSLTVPGAHMAANALGALAAGATLGVEVSVIAAALATFRGARRRFEVVGEAAGVIVIDDFAHHPTEIRVNLAAARERFPGRRLVVAFQPHTFSRTAYLLDDFLTCFKGADVLFILETFASRETAAAGMGAQELASALTSPRAVYLGGSEDAPHRLTAELRSGDVLLTIGAGDVDRVGRAVLESLRAS